MIEFDVPGEPKPKLRPRARKAGAHARVYDDPKSKKWEQALAKSLQPHAPTEPIDEPVQLGLLFCFLPPESWPKWKKVAAERGNYQHVARPDVDNLTKLAMDALSRAGFWTDDTRVCTVVATKAYATRAYTRVRIHPLTQPTYHPSKRDQK